MVPLTKPTVVFLFFSLFLNVALAQTTVDTSVLKSDLTDTTVSKPAKDSTQVISPVRKVPRLLRDSTSGKHSIDSTKIFLTDSVRFGNKKPQEFLPLPAAWMDLLSEQPNFNFSGKPVHISSRLHISGSYDGLFYLLVALLFFFAIVKLLFRKYLANLFTLFFRASMRQQQLREQVLQSPFPSLLLNILFLVSGGLYGAFLVRYFRPNDDAEFWRQFVFFIVILGVLYFIKFVALRVVGWIFNINRAVETYLFVVFLANKIIGIFLLPFLVLLSFSDRDVAEIAITLSVMMIGVFYIYRFIAGYNTLHKEIKISGLYYLLYLCAFEIAPLMLIYKVLVNYLEKA